MTPGKPARPDAETGGAWHFGRLVGRRRPQVFPNRARKEADPLSVASP